MTPIFAPIFPKVYYMSDIIKNNPPIIPPTEWEGVHTPSLDVISFVEVEERLVEAMMQFEMLNPERGSSMAKDGPWSRIVPDFAALVAGEELDPGAAMEALRSMAARPRNLSAAEVARMEATLAWLDHVPARGEMRRIVGAVLREIGKGGSQVDWGRVARSIGTRSSRDAIRMSYSRAITRVTQRVNAAQKRAGMLSSPGVLSGKCIE